VTLSRDSTRIPDNTSGLPFTVYSPFSCFKRVLTMTAISLAIVGKHSEPLYIKHFYGDVPRTDEDLMFEEELFGLPTPSESSEASAAVSKRSECSLRQQFILHAALDRFEQLDGPPPGYVWRRAGVSGADAMFLGLLCPVEDMRVYGKFQVVLLRRRSGDASIH